MASSSMMRMLAGLACSGMVCGEEYQTVEWRASCKRRCWEFRIGTIISGEACFLSCELKSYELTAQNANFYTRGDSLARILLKIHLACRVLRNSGGVGPGGMG